MRLHRVRHALRPFTVLLVLWIVGISFSAHADMWPYDTFNNPRAEGKYVGVDFADPKTGKTGRMWIPMEQIAYINYSDRFFGQYEQFFRRHVDWHNDGYFTYEIYLHDGFDGRSFARLKADEIVVGIQPKTVERVSELKEVSSENILNVESVTEGNGNVKKVVRYFPSNRLIDGLGGLVGIPKTAITDRQLAYARLRDVYWSEAPRRPAYADMTWLSQKMGREPPSYNQVNDQLRSMRVELDAEVTNTFAKKLKPELNKITAQPEHQGKEFVQAIYTLIVDKFKKMSLTKREDLAKMLQKQPFDKASPFQCGYPPRADFLRQETRSIDDDRLGNVGRIDSSAIGVAGDVDSRNIDAESGSGRRLA